MAVRGDVQCCHCRRNNDTVLLLLLLWSLWLLYVVAWLFLLLFQLHSVLDLSVGGGGFNHPSGASQHPNFVSTSRKIVQISQKYIADPFFGFPTNRILVKFVI